MKAKSIHSWCVESEFIVRNWFHNWTSDLVYICVFFGKLDSFWLFSCTSVLAATRCCLYWSTQKASNFLKMCQMHPNSDVQLWNQFLIINSDSKHQEWMKFAFIVTGSIFLHSYWDSDNVLRNFVHCTGWKWLLSEWDGGNSYKGCAHCPLVNC